MPPPQVEVAEEPSLGTAVRLGQGPRVGHRLVHRGSQGFDPAQIDDTGQPHHAIRFVTRPFALRDRPSLFVIARSGADRDSRLIKTT